MEYSKKLCDNLLETKIKERRETVNFYVLLLVLILITVAVIHLNFFVFMNIEVSGRSMETTLQNGDHLITVRNATPERGDIIIINKTTHKSAETTDYYYIIKRVIAIGGDVVEIKEDGKVYLNGEMLAESYLDDFQTTNVYNFATGVYEIGYVKYELKQGEIFYLGDNRLASQDARVNGPCKDTDVIGVVSEFSVKHRKTLTDIYKFFRSIPELFGKS